MNSFIRNKAMPLAAIPLLGLSVSAMAAAGDSTGANTTQVAITATVVNNTCAVGSDNSWDLNSVNGSAIMSGMTAVPEVIDLSNCGSALTGIIVTPTGGAIGANGVIANSLTASNGSTTASNVEAEILTGDNATKQEVMTDNTPETFTPVEGQATQTLKFNVKLLQNGTLQPTPGNFKANITMKLAYE